MNMDQPTSDGKSNNGQTHNHVDKQPDSGDESGFEPAVRISRQRIRKGKQEYLSYLEMAANIDAMQ